MRLVFLGPPGSGKGTQAERLAQRLGLEHVSTGDMFRRAIERKTAVGLKVEMLVKNGELVPDGLVGEVVRAHLAERSNQHGFILDGFPRTVQQAEMLEQILAERGWSLDAAVSFRVPEAVVIERLGGRRVCSRCGATYHVTALPAGETGCPRCGGTLVIREDDKADAVRRRLEIYWQTARPVEEYYRERGLLRVVDADKSIEQVEEALLQIIGGDGHGAH